LVCAAGALAERDMAPELLVGHSLGGAAVLGAARQIESSKAVVTIGAPFDPGHVTHNFEGALDQIEAHGAAEVTLGGRQIRIGRDFVDNARAESLEADIAGLRRALLILHAPRDATVGIENASEIFTRAKHPKSFVTLEGADHLISDPADAEYAADVIAAWAQRYVDLPKPAPPPGAPEGIVRVTEADPQGFAQDISSGPLHHLLADEPVAYGGTNLGPSPYGLLSAGLGACTSMTLRMYARRKGWPLKSVSVDVSHNKVHAQDAANTGEAKADTFSRVIHLEGELSDEQRQRLLEIADRCPVHQTLEKGAKVATRLHHVAFEETAS
ncbi:MAG: bifunctional alpha/beta hydrolase/OsmC family protein, partial [Pseudomonadota bacterium]